VEEANLEDGEASGIWCTASVDYEEDEDVSSAPAKRQRV
jgi:hypothetical protein